MDAKFLAVGSFFIRSRKLFVVVGDVVEGEIQTGMEVIVPLGDISVSAPVRDVEVIDVTFLPDFERTTHGYVEYQFRITNNSKDRHHVVADVLIDHPTVTLDNAIHDLEIAVEERMGLLGVEFIRQPGEAREIGEQDRDLAAITHGRHWLRWDCPALSVALK